MGISIFFSSTGKQPYPLPFTFLLYFGAPCTREESFWAMSEKSSSLAEFSAREEENPTWDVDEAT